MVIMIKYNHQKKKIKKNQRSVIYYIEAYFIFPCEKQVFSFAQLSKEAI